MILGIGSDFASVERIGALWGRNREGMERRVFTKGEIEYCMARPEPEQHLAVRYAAKEAALKALGTGWAKGIGLADVEVTRADGERPGIGFHGRAGEVAAALGVRKAWLTLSHDGGFALAFVVLEGEPFGDQDAGENRG